MSWMQREQDRWEVSDDGLVFYSMHLFFSYGCGAWAGTREHR
jgi:hypothetical protein